MEGMPRIIQIQKRRLLVKTCPTALSRIGFTVHYGIPLFMLQPIERVFNGNNKTPIEERDLAGVY